MLKLLWAECQKLRRSSIALLTIFATVLAAVVVFIGASYSNHQFFCFDKTGKRDVPHVCCFSVHYRDTWK